MTTKMKLYTAIIIMILIILTTSLIMYQTSKNTETPPDTLNNDSWQRPLKSFATSLTVNDGKILTTDDPGNIYCFDSQNGESLWNTTVNGRIRYSTPVISDGRIYVGFEERQTCCLDENTGEILWTFKNEAVSSESSKGNSPQIIVKDNRIIAITGMVTVHNATNGEFLWKALNGQIMNDATDQSWLVQGFLLNGDPYDANYVYGVGGSDISNMNFFKLNTDNGEVIWSSEKSWESPIIMPSLFAPKVLAIDQHQIVICNSQELFSLDSNTGEQLWGITIDGRLDTSIVYNHFLVISASDKAIYKVNLADGSTDWKFTVGTNIYSPTIQDNLLLFAASDGYFYSLDLTKNKVSWKNMIDPENLLATVEDPSVTQPVFLNTSQGEKVFWSFAVKTGEDQGNFSAIICSLNITNGNSELSKQIKDSWFSPNIGLTVSEERIFLMGNNALRIFNASTGDLLQTQQFDHYIKLQNFENKTYVSGDLWLFAFTKQE